MSIVVTDRTGLGPERFHSLASQIAAHTTLGDVLDWGRKQDPPRRVDEIITQDEYTHDVLVALAPPLYLAYDVS